MDDSKILIPSSWLLTFYYHYLNSVLIITWLLALQVFYVILTQSKNMKVFKWLKLHQSFWGLTFETMVCIAKPLFLAPSPAGIPLGPIFRDDGTFYKTTIVILLIVFCGINYAVGLAVTTINRYILAFPSTFTKYLNVKIVLLLTIPFYIAFYTAVGILATRTLSLDVEIILQKSKNYDKFFENFNESSLVYVPMEYAESFGYFIFLSLNGLIAAAITIIFIFFYFVQRSTAKSVTKIQRSMIISSIVEISIICVFLISPVNAVCACITFQIYDSTWISVICACLISTHGICDFIATLIFVLPYQRYLKNQILKFPFLKRKIQPTANITIVPT